MRQLTKTEIENAPSWATDYTIIENEVRWSNDEFFEWNTGATMGVKARRHREFIKKPKPIPNTEFEAIRKSFVTCNSDGEGHYNVTLEATTLKEAQAIHREILRLRLR